jgi:hypothetical protein
VEKLELTTTALEELDGEESTTAEEEVVMLVVPPTDSEAADATTVVKLEVGDVKLHEARLRFTVGCSTSLSTIWEACFATSAW